jgi:hypothetical protein
MNNGVTGGPTRAAVLALALAACASGVSAADTPETAVVKAPLASQGGDHVWYGTVRDVRGTRLFLTLRTGKTLVVDATKPLTEHTSVLLTPTRHVIVKGVLGAGGIVRADFLLRSNTSAQFWPADR